MTTFPEEMLPAKDLIIMAKKQGCAGVYNRNLLQDVYHTFSSSPFIEYNKDTVTDSAMNSQTETVCFSYSIWALILLINRMSIETS